jgi:hypothetical protein
MKQDATFIKVTFLCGFKYQGVRSKIRLYEALRLLTLPNSNPMIFGLEHQKSGMYLNFACRMLCVNIMSGPHVCSQFVHRCFTMARQYTSYNFVLRLPFSQRENV